MASRFKVGPSSGSLTSLDALTTPLPDPQPEFQQYVSKVLLANGQYFGRGPRRITWEFPLLEVEQQAQIISSVATSPMYIQSPDVEDVDTVWEVDALVPDPRESGDHMNGFKGHRSGLLIVFTVLAEVP